jgi:hypothetical protein
VDKQYPRSLKQLKARHQPWIAQFPQLWSLGRRTCVILPNPSSCIPVALQAVRHLEVVNGVLHATNVVSHLDTSMLRVVSTDNSTAALAS